MCGGGGGGLESGHLKKLRSPELYWTLKFQEWASKKISCDCESVVKNVLSARPVDLENFSHKM